MNTQQTETDWTNIDNVEDFLRKNHQCKLIFDKVLSRAICAHAQCKSKTVSGEPCKNHPSEGYFCKVHQSQSKINKNGMNYDILCKILNDIRSFTTRLPVIGDRIGNNYSNRIKKHWNKIPKEGLDTIEKYIN